MCTLDGHLHHSHALPELPGQLARSSDPEARPRAKAVSWATASIPALEWIGLRENLQETIAFTIKQ